MLLRALLIARVYYQLINHGGHRRNLRCTTNHPTHPRFLDHADQSSRLGLNGLDGSTPDTYDHRLCPTARNQYRHELLRRRRRHLLRLLLLLLLLLPLMMVIVVF